MEQSVNPGLESGIILDAKFKRLEKVAYDRANDNALQLNDVVSIPSDWNGYEDVYEGRSYQRLVLLLNNKPRTFSVSTIFGTNNGAFKRSNNILQSMEAAVGKSFRVRFFEHIDRLNIDRPVFEAV